jgi:hypothetical protein
MAAGGGDILRIVGEVQTRETKKEIAIAGKKDKFIEVEDERYTPCGRSRRYPSRPVTGGRCWTLIRDSWQVRSARASFSLLGILEKLNK